MQFISWSKGNLQHTTDSQSDGRALIVQSEATAACAESIVRAQSINPDTRCTKEVGSSKTKQTVGPQASEPQMSRCAKTRFFILNTEFLGTWRLQIVCFAYGVSVRCSSSEQTEGTFHSTVLQWPCNAILHSGPSGRSLWASIVCQRDQRSIFFPWPVM